MSQIILPRSGILAFMDDESRERFAGYGSVLATMPNQVIIQEGEPNTQLYVVLGGTFNITTGPLGDHVHLDTVGIGDCLGEVAIFHPDRASATVTSLQIGQLWNIGVGALQQFLYDWPNDGSAAMLGINVILSRRLKRANAVIQRNEILPAFLSVRSQKKTLGVKQR
jgi:CRP-like cAMP-binding protein